MLLCDGVYNRVCHHENDLSIGTTVNHMLVTIIPTFL